MRGEARELSVPHINRNTLFLETVSSQLRNWNSYIRKNKSFGTRGRERETVTPILLDHFHQQLQSRGLRKPHSACLELSSHFSPTVMASSTSLCMCTPFLLSAKVCVTLYKKYLIFFKDVFLSYFCTFGINILLKHLYFPHSWLSPAWSPSCHWSNLSSLLMLLFAQIYSFN